MEELWTTVLGALGFFGQYVINVHVEVEGTLFARELYVGAVRETHLC